MRERWHGTISSQHDLYRFRDHIREEGKEYLGHNQSYPEKITVTGEVYWLVREKARLEKSRAITPLVSIWAVLTGGLLGGVFKLGRSVYSVVEEAHADRANELARAATHIAHFYYRPVSDDGSVLVLKFTWPYDARVTSHPRLY